MGAVGTGLLASSGPLGLLKGEISTLPLQQLPASLVPSFAVPLWIIIHVISLLQLRKARQAHEHGVALRQREAPAQPTVV